MYITKCVWEPDSSMVQVIVCCISGAKPLHGPMLTCYQMDPWEMIPFEFVSKYILEGNAFDYLD